MPDIGDIKSSLLTINHNGWYNLNGQQIDENTKPYAAQNASTIFGGTFLPDLSDAVLSQQTLKTISGTNDVNVLIDNLPNLSLSGATSPFSDVVNTDLNGSGLQPLIDGTTVGSTLPVTTGFGGGLITTLNGSTVAHNGLATSTSSGVVVANGDSSTLSSSVVNTTSGTRDLNHKHSGQSGNLILTTGGGAASVLGIANGDTPPAGTDTWWGPVYGAAEVAWVNTTNHPTNHDHDVSVTLPAHSHTVSVNIPSHSHDVDINIPSLGVTTPFNMSGHTHDLDVNIPSTSVTGNVNIPTHSHAMDLEIPSLAVTVPLNGLQQPLSVKGKRFGVNFFIYLGIG